MIRDDFDSIEDFQDYLEMLAIPFDEDLPLEAYDPDNFRDVGYSE